MDIEIFVSLIVKLENNASEIMLQDIDNAIVSDTIDLTDEDAGQYDYNWILESPTTTILLPDGAPSVTAVRTERLSPAPSPVGAECWTTPGVTAEIGGKSAT